MAVGPEFEPSAAAREMAKTTRDMFGALVLAGFTESQALQIIGVMIAAGIANNGS